MALTDKERPSVWYMLYLFFWFVIFVAIISLVVALFFAALGLGGDGSGVMDVATKLGLLAGMICLAWLLRLCKGLHQPLYGTFEIAVGAVGGWNALSRAGRDDWTTLGFQLATVVYLMTRGWINASGEVQFEKPKPEVVPPTPVDLASATRVDPRYRDPKKLMEEILEKKRKGEIPPLNLKLK